MLLEDLDCLLLTPPAHCISQSNAPLLTVKPNEHVLVIFLLDPSTSNPLTSRDCQILVARPLRPLVLCPVVTSRGLLSGLFWGLPFGLLTPSHSNRLKYVCPKLKSTLVSHPPWNKIKALPRQRALSPVAVVFFSMLSAEYTPCSSVMANLPSYEALWSIFTRSFCARNAFSCILSLNINSSFTFSLQCHLLGQTM